MLDLNTFYKLEEFEKQQVNVKMVYIDITGDLIAGILLSQIIYWNLPSKEGKSKLKVTYKGRKGIAKGRNEWWDEIRITPKQYDRAIKILKELELVEVKNTMFNAKRTPVIMFNSDVFIKKYQSKLTKSTVLPKGKDRCLPKVKSGIDETATSLTETTTKITTENTKNIYTHHFSNDDAFYKNISELFEHIEEVYNDMIIDNGLTLGNGIHLEWDKTDLHGLKLNLGTFYNIMLKNKGIHHSRLTTEQMTDIIYNVLDTMAMLDSETITDMIEGYFNEKQRYYSMQQFFSEESLAIYTVRYQ